jgi:hypothetical protein
VVVNIFYLISPKEINENISKIAFMTFFNSHFCGFDKKPLVQSPRKIRKAAYTHISGFRKLLETL